MINIANCTKEEFARRSKNSKIICFCAGEKFLELCREFHITNNIAYVVDNYKAGKSINIDQKIIPIKSIDEVGDEIKNCMIIIASNDYAEVVLRQIDMDKRTENMLVYCPYLLTIREEQMSLDSNNEQVIPKKIHYCWFGNNDMPKQFVQNIESWKKYCPDYEIIRWDESNYDITKNKYMKQAYENKMWGFVSDYVRVDVVNQYGGIYLDTDVEVVKSFDELLNFSMFCGFQNKWQVNFGLGFGAKRNHIALRELLSLYEKLEFINEDGTFNKTTCPFYQTQILKQHGLIENGKIQKLEDALVLSEEYFSPINPWGLGWITDNTFSIHQYVGTWAGDEWNNRDIVRRKFFEERLVRI